MLSRQRDERGVTAVLVAVLMGAVLLVSAAFAVDLGQQRVVRRDMQAVADVVALDLARLLTGGTAASYDKSTIDTAKNQSVARNDKALGGKLDDADVAWDFVKRAGDQWVVVQKTSSETPTGIKVTAESDTKFAFGGVTGVARGGSTRTAVASAEETACFRLGSYVARLDAGSSALLKPLIEGALGGNLGLDVGSYQGLVDANVGLLDIATELGVGSVNELLTTDVSFADLVLASATALQKNGGGTADVEALETIAANVGDHNVKVGDLISAASGGEAAESLEVNALDLITSSIFLANGSNFLDVPNLAVSLPITGTSLQATLQLIQKAQQACGKKSVASAESSQLALDISGTLVNPAPILGFNIVGGATTIKVNVAPATGLLTDVICGAGTVASPSGEDVRVTSGLASATVSTTVAINGKVSAGGLLGSLLGGLGSLLGQVLELEVTGSVSLSAGIADPSTVKTAPIRVPVDPATFDDPYPLGSGDLSINQATVIPTTTLVIKAKGLLGLNVALNANQILGITNNLVAGLVSNLTNPLITTVNTTLLSPLSDLLGLSIGGADVFGSDPVCSATRLVG